MYNSIIYNNANCEIKPSSISSCLFLASSCLFSLLFSFFRRVLRSLWLKYYRKVYKLSWTTSQHKCNHGSSISIENFYTMFNLSFLLHCCKFSSISSIDSLHVPSTSSIPTQNLMLAFIQAHSLRRLIYTQPLMTFFSKQRRRRHTADETCAKFRTDNSFVQRVLEIAAVLKGLLL